MSQPGSESISVLLEKVSSTRPGEPEDRELTDRLYQEVYQNLRRIAGGMMRRESPDHSLRPTDVVHDAYLKMVKGAEVSWQGRAHFLSVAAVAIRHILVDHARRKATSKRGGDLRRVTLANAANIGSAPELEVIALHGALTRLEHNDKRMARIVELRAFAGLTAVESAYILGVSKRTIDRDFQLARMWLRREIGGPSPSIAS